MSKPYKFEENNPFLDMNSLKIYHQLLTDCLGGDLATFGDLLVDIKLKTRFYIIKDETGYKIVDAEAEV